MTLNEMKKLRDDIDVQIAIQEDTIANSKRVDVSDNDYVYNVVESREARAHVNARIVVSERSARKHNVSSDSKLASIIKLMQANYSTNAIIAQMSNRMTSTRVKANISYIKRNKLM
jgi:hypothetical protein